MGVCYVATMRLATRREVAILAVLAVGLVAVVALLVKPFDPDTACCDHLFYRSMAYNEFGQTRPDLDVPPAGNSLSSLYGSAAFPWLDEANGLARQPPYAYRIVTPAIARGLASVIGINAGFYVLTFAALVAAALLMGLSVFALTGALLPSAVAVALVALNPATAHLDLYDYMLTDPVALCLVALAVYALITRRPVVFYVACLVGVFNRESMLPMVACYPLSEYLIDRRRPATWAPAVGVVGAWLALRVFWPIPVNRYSLVNEFVGTFARARMVVSVTLVTFGVLVFTVWRGIFTRWAWVLAPFALASFAAAWFAGDTSRIIVEALPVFIIATLARWPVDARERRLVLLPAAGFLFGVVAYELGVPHSLLLPALGLIVIANELLLAREWLGRRSVHEPVSLVDY
jgi:hypothetical protein